MALKIASEVKYPQLASVLPQVKELNFDEADVFINFNNMTLDLHTNNGFVAVNFDTYNELLDAVIALGRELAFRDILHSLNRVIDDLTFYMEHPHLEITEDVISNLLNEVEKAKDRLFKSNYKLMIRIGELPSKDIEYFIDSNPEIKKAVKNATAKYRELCWESYEDGDPNYCDKVVPVVDVIYYAVPEEKTIMIVVKVDQIGEIYRVTEKYDNAYDFLKAVDEYSNKVVDFW